MVSPLDTSLAPLLKVVFESILEVFLQCLAGYILAREGILDRKTQKQLNRVNVSLFTPSLLFSKVAFFLSPAKLRELWIIPIFFVVVTVVSMVVAYFMAVLFRLKRSQRSFAIAASMFMNSNSLPIALMQSLVVTFPGLKWDDDDNADAMLGRALTYLVLYSTMGMVLRWSYGVRLLAQADPETNETAAAADTEAEPLIDSDETAFPPSPDEQLLHRHSYHPDGSERMLTDSRATIDSSPETITVIKDAGNGRGHPGLLQLHRRPTIHAFPNTLGTKGRASKSGNHSEAASSVFHSGSDGEDELEFPPHRQNGTEPSSSKFQSFWRRSKNKVAKKWRGFNEFMTVPLWAALASLIVACIAPLQHALDDHFPPVKNALTAAGNCSIPITLVVLGAYFYTPEDTEEQGRIRLPTDQEEGQCELRSVKSSASLRTFVGSVKDMFSLTSLRSKKDKDIAREPEKRPGETKTVFVGVVARMIVTPLLLLPLIALSAKWDWQRVLEDPVFVVSNVLLIAAPPALTLAQITQAASGDAFERLISRTIFWAYCIVTPPTTIIYVVVGLLLSRL